MAAQEGPSSLEAAGPGPMRGPFDGRELSAQVERLIAAPGWHTSLAQYARATGLSVALYDRAGNLRAGPFTANPLSMRLESSGAWRGDGVCLQADREAAAIAIERGTVLHHRGLVSLALFAVPIRVDDQRIGAVVGGWVFDAFPDPIDIDRLAAILSMSFPQLWQIVRQQPPASLEKLGTYAELLQTITELFVRERVEIIREQEQSRGLRALYSSAQQLASASSVPQIGGAVVEAVVALSGSTRVCLQVLNDDRWTIAARGGTDVSPVRDNRPGGPRAVVSTLRVPVEAADGTLLAVIEIDETSREDQSRYRTQIAAIAAQTAVALQKVRLIQDLEKERAALEQANRAKDLFLATLSHELRTPLTPILNWISIIREGEGDRELLATGIEAIERCANQELHLVEEMLDLTRILNNKVTLELTAVDVMSLITVAASNNAPAAAERGLTLRVAAEESLPPIHADAHRVQQVLGALVSNALKFTPERGTITLGARRAGEKVELCVSDTGVGIPPEHIPFIFDRFRQVDSTSRRRHGGLGIGLAVVKGLVDLHGGELRVESSPGRGSTFYVALPVARDGTPSVAGGAEPIREEPHNGGKHGRVLIVDDAIDTLVSIAMLLERAGYTVETAGSALEGMQRMRTFEPDVIVSDLGMPDLDGYDFLRMLRQEKNAKEVPVIALTGFATLQDRDAALEAGFAAHLPKPVDLSVLLRVIERVAATNGER